MIGPVPEATVVVTRLVRNARPGQYELALPTDREHGDRPCESLEFDSPEILESMSSTIVANRADGALIGEHLAGFSAGAQPGGKVHRRSNSRVFQTPLAADRTDGDVPTRDPDS
jgi:hypothetical protein